MAGEMFSNLSAFYVELWEHMDAFFDDTRWLRLYSVPGIEERADAMTARYAKLCLDLGEPTLVEQVRRDFKDVEALTKEYMERKPEPDSPWFSRVNKMRGYLQELGLRYAELASAGVEGG